MPISELFISGVKARYSNPAFSIGDKKRCEYPRRHTGPQEAGSHIHAAGDLSEIEGIVPEQQGLTQRSSLYSPKG